VLVATGAKQDQDRDDGLRGDSGVVVSLVERPDGKVRLVFDDVQRNRLGEPAAWNHKFFFTRTEVELDALLDTKLSEAELAQIGFAIAARLAAHKKVAG
jgi:hypothetical protein